MCPKEDSEIITIKKACLISVDVFTKYLKDQIMEIIDSDKVYFSILYEILAKYGKKNRIKTLRLYLFFRKLNIQS